MDDTRMRRSGRSPSLWFIVIRMIDELWRVIGERLDAFTPIECPKFFA